MKLPGEELVVDTNVLVHWLRGKEVGQKIRELYDLGHRRPRPIVPAVVIGEIRSIAQWNNWGEKKLRALDSVLNGLIAYPIEGDELMMAYAEIDCLSRSLGRKMGKNDLWIAAIAKVHEAVVLTRDGDFDHLNPGVIRVESF